MSKYWATRTTKPLADENTRDMYIMDRVASVAEEPSPLPDGLEWSSPGFDEIHDFLGREFNDSAVSVKFSKEFLEWVLKSPRTHAEYIVGVSRSGKLVAMITGIPATCAIDGVGDTDVIDISFLCVDRTLRGGGLVPKLSAEITRRINLNGVYCGMFMAADVLFGRLATCKFFCRPLNVEKVVPGAKGLGLPRRTKANLVQLDKQLVAKALKFVNATARTFPVAKIYSLQEFKYFFLPRDGMVETFVDLAPNCEVQGLVNWYINNSGDLRVGQITQVYSKNHESLFLDTLIKMTATGVDVVTALGTAGNLRSILRLKFQETEKNNFYLYGVKYPMIDPSRVCYHVF